MEKITGSDGYDFITMTLENRGMPLEIDLLGDDDDIDYLEQYLEALEENAPGITGIQVDMVAGTVSDTAGVTSTIRNVEGFFGTDLDDSFIGGDADEIFRPFGGADVIVGGAGRDLLHYGLDFHALGYARGINAVFGEGGAVGTVEDPSGSIDQFSGIERIRTTVFADRVVGNSENNQFQLFGGGDVIDGGGGRDQIRYDTFETNNVYESLLKQGILIDLSVVDAEGYVQVVTPLGGGDIDRVKSIETVVGSSLNDMIGGDAGSNYLEGAAGNDRLSGREGNDTIRGGAGDDTIDGGAGIDTAEYLGNRADHQVTATSVAGGFNVRVVDVRSVDDNLNGSDTLTAVERLQFDDGVLAFDLDGNAGQAYRIYQAAFARTPDNDGLKYWIDALDSDMTLIDVARGFVSSAEFQSVYGVNPSNLSLVEKLYENVLGRSGEAAGIAFWESELNSGNRDQAQVLMDFAESAENIQGVAPAIADGIFFS